MLVLFFFNLIKPCNHASGPLCFFGCVVAVKLYVLSSSNAGKEWIFALARVDSEFGVRLERH